MNICDHLHSEESRDFPYLRRSILEKSVLKIKRMFPPWGYRRIWSYLRYSCGIAVSKNKVFFLLKKCARRNRSSFRTLAPSLFFEKPGKFQHLWHMDMIKLPMTGYGHLYVVFVIDTTTGKILGHYAGLRCQSWHWLQALNNATYNHFERDLAPIAGVCLVTDSKSQPTSISFMRSCWDLGLNHRVRHRTLPKNIFSKEFEKWIKKKMSISNSPKSLKETLTILGANIRDFNKSRPHGIPNFSGNNALSVRFGEHAAGALM